MAWDPIDDTELRSGFNALIHMRKAWNCLKWLYGNVGTMISTSIQNPSFEIDSDGNGVPDSWTWAGYPGGTKGLDTAVPAHGASCFKITHPGGAGNGGGVLSSDYIECSALKALFLGFIHWASAAGMHNKVQVRFFTAAKVYISGQDLYNCTNNPTIPTYIVAAFIPPATARYYKIDLIGGHTDTNVAGTAYFDGLGEAGLEATYGLPFNFTMAEASTVIYADYVDAATIDIPLALSGIPVVITFPIELKAGQNAEVFCRFKLGAIYSAEISEVSIYYVQHTITIAGLVPTGQASLIMQLKATDQASAAICRKTTATAQAIRS